MARNWGAMNKIYAVTWGFYSSNEGGNEYDSFWTSEELAKKRIQEIANNRVYKLSPIKEVFKKYKERNDFIYTDGDYWISYEEYSVDTPSMYGNESDDWR